MTNMAKAIAFAALLTGITIEQVEGKTSDIRIPPPTPIIEQPSQPDSELGTLRIRKKTDDK